MGRSYGEYHGRNTPRVSQRSPMQHLVKRRGWEKGEVTERCQQPARVENTNDDDEMITFISWQLRTVTVGLCLVGLHFLLLHCFEEISIPVRSWSSSWSQSRDRGHESVVSRLNIPARRSVIIRHSCTRTEHFWWSFWVLFRSTVVCLTVCNEKIT